MPSSEKQGPGHTLQVTGSLKSDGRTPHTSVLISVVVINKDHRVVFSRREYISLREARSVSVGLRCTAFLRSLSSDFLSGRT